MKDIKITTSMIQDNEKIHTNNKPVRFAIATNVLFLTKHKNTQQYYFLMYNYDPVNWKQVYPYFTSYAKEILFESDTFSGILKEMQMALNAQGFSLIERIENTKKDFSSTIGCTNCELLKIEELPDEYWLKYSQTKNVWTIYLIEFFVAKINSKIDLKNIENTDKLLLPLDEKTLKEINQTGKWDKFPIVENTIEILRNEKLLALLKKNAVEI